MLFRFFPYKAYTKANKEYVGPHLPADQYCVETMSPARRAECEQYLVEMSDVEFNMRESVLNYCDQDVTLLRKGCLSFRYF